jgi:hypothetical protein
VGYGDIFAKLGGLKSALGPVFNIVVPMTIFWFLWTLVKIIKASYKKQYLNELENTVKFYYDKLAGIKNLQLKLTQNFKHSDF